MGYENHTKIAYIKKGDIEEAIHQGKIDDYDVCITKDTGEVLFVSPDKGIRPTRSRIYCFKTYEEAQQYINTSEDTYEGQVISIFEGTEYRGYVVNRRNNKYWADPLAAPEIHVDYYQVHEVTKAEYDALPDDKLTNSNIYLITDEDPIAKETVEAYLDDNEYCRLFVKPEVSIAHLLLNKDVDIAPNKTGYFDLLTIPEAYRPKYDGKFPVYYGQDGDKSTFCTVGSDGAVRIFCKDSEPLVSPFGSYIYFY